MAKASTSDESRELAQSGELCLAFANTAAARHDDRYRHSTPPETEALTDYSGLITWGQRMGTLYDGVAERLLRKAAKQPEEAAEVFAKAMTLRHALMRIFTAVAMKKTPSPEGLSILNSALAELVPARQVAIGGEGFRWAWSGNDDALDRMLWPVVQSAAELLISDDHKWVRQCAEKHCTRLFVDRRSRRRLWCDPNTCGSRVKGRRFYRKSGRSSY